MVDGAAGLSAMLLCGAARGSHAARKHLLLASVSGGDDGALGSMAPAYISVAPEAGFGS